MIELLAAVLTTMLKDEQSFARAEGLYAEYFRCAETFKVADGHYPRSTLVQYLMEPIYRRAHSEKASGFCDENDDEDFDRWDEDTLEPEVLKPGMSLEQAEQVVDHLEFVELCNYKGEGEGGFELACRVAHLRVFISKYEYQAA
ncbi:hypothetical protein [Pseudomonas baetica]|uniref:hypothetical protein n=1 Tax=Pseudomonas baetica TaxID=674054 RepID=UPI002404F2B5|nr:hypothetical protein [Pseudomonas baetica]MDF9779041.1 hypothetical protein [Pseudomonas baetica]